MIPVVSFEETILFLVDGLSCIEVHSMIAPTRPLSVTAPLVISTFAKSESWKAPLPFAGSSQHASFLYLRVNNIASKIVSITGLAREG
jgi:hypothetical protein